MDKSIKIKVTALASSLVASVLLLGSASAEGFQSKSTKVSFADLDLSTATGVSAAHERVQEAARRVCRAVADHLDLSSRTHFFKCVDEVMSGSMPRLDAFISQSNASSKVAMNR